MIRTNSNGLASISAVVVTYNSADCVALALESVRNTLPDAELVVVDNDSQDGSLAIARAAAPEARVLELGANLGFGRACNVAAEAARRSHLLFLNPDAALTAVDPDRLEALLESRPFGLLAPMIEGEGDRRLPESSWPRDYVAHTLETLRPRGWRGRASRGVAADGWVGGVMLLALREEFLALGGFDPRFFLYYEDRDLSRRYRSSKLPIRTTDALRGRHTAGTSSASDDLRAGPMAWSLLGWIQYLYIHSGEQTARRAAVATLTTLRVLRRAVHGLAALGVPRTRRKARQLDELFRLLAEQSARDDAGFCPDALRLLRGPA